MSGQSDWRATGAGVVAGLIVVVSVVGGVAWTLMANDGELNDRASLWPEQGQAALGLGTWAVGIILAYVIGSAVADRVRGQIALGGSAGTAASIGGVVGTGILAAALVAVVIIILLVWIILLAFAFMLGLIAVITATS